MSHDVTQAVFPYVSVLWGQHDEVGASLVPDHLPELGRAILCWAITHDHQLWFQVAVHIVSTKVRHSRWRVRVKRCVGRVKERLRKFSENYYSIAYLMLSIRYAILQERIRTGG